MFPTFMIVNPKYLVLDIKKFAMIDMSFIDWIGKKDMSSINKMSVCVFREECNNFRALALRIIYTVLK